MKVVAHENEKILAIERWDGADRILLIANLNTTSADRARSRFSMAAWHKILDSAEEKWRGPGTLLDDELDGRQCDRIKLAPRSFGLFHCQRT